MVISMTQTIREVFGPKYNYEMQEQNPERFRDYVKSRVSYTNLAAAVHMSRQAVAYRMERPIMCMQMIADNADEPIELRGAWKIRKDNEALSKQPKVLPGQTSLFKEGK